MFKKDLILGQEYLAWLLLNLVDLWATGWIFKHHGEEANAIALFILNHFGLVGFVIYKFLLVTLVVVVCETISARSLAKARVVIWVGCVTYFLIVCYEVYLIFFNISLPLAHHENPAINLGLTLLGL